VGYGAAVDDAPQQPITVVVEIPRGGFVKRRADGEVDFVSPVPCPWNYGSAPAITGGDGDPQDVVVLGSRLPRGAEVRVRVRAVARFVDAGRTDDKLIAGDRALGPLDRLAIRAFFSVYARFKRALNRARGLSGRTAFGGLD